MKKLLTALLRSTLLLLLTFLVSGALPLVMQGYAWFDMTVKAGGISQLGWVMTEAAPCQHCMAAAEAMQETSNESSDRNMPTGHSFEFLKNVTFEEALVPSFDDAGAVLEWSFPFPEDSIRSGQCENSPLTPPPQVAVS